MITYKCANCNKFFERSSSQSYKYLNGQYKLEQIQNNDNRKFQACIEAGIELCIIDVSGQKYFKPKSSQRFLNIICNIINNSCESQI